MQIKYMIAIIVLLGVISIYLGSLSCLDQEYTAFNKQDLNNFSKEEISFKYPDVFKLENSTTNNFTVNNYISKLINPYENEFITINRQYNPPGHDPKNFIIEEWNGSESKIDLIDNKKYTVKNTDVYDNTYKLKNDSSMLIRELWVYKNNAVYSIILTGKKSNTIDLIRDSLNIQFTSLKEKFIFATLTIPKLDCKWDIRYDTVNAINGVYHYNISSYPGEKGTVGLLGHHVTYSAPFKKLDRLVKGDKVYINDFLTQKKYTYEVEKVATDDIKYDYETNKIQFDKKSNGLIMGTCWPPGYTTAECYCHCKLISVEPI